MSKKSYTPNKQYMHKVLCTWTTSRGVKSYIYISYAKEANEAEHEAIETVSWGKHPTFRARVIKSVETG